MRVLILHPGLVEVAISANMKEIQLIHESTFLQHFQSTVDGYPIQLRILFLRKVKQTLGIEMLPGFIDQIEQDLPLTREANASLLQRILDAFPYLRHSDLRLPRIKTAVHSVSEQPDPGSFVSLCKIC